MDPVQNPYSPGAGSRPPALTGRDEQIAAFQVLLERLRHGRSEKSLMITGLRGVGKTVLLNTFEDLSEKAGFSTAMAEITHDTDFRGLLARLARRALLAVSPLERMKALAKRAAGVLKAFTLRLPDGYEIGINVDALRGRGDSGNLSDDVSDLFIALGGAAKEGQTGVAILLDEVQFLKRDQLEALIAAIHLVSQRNLPLTIVGAGLPQLPALTGEAKSYSERLFNYPKIDALPAEAAREALERPAREQGVAYEPQAITAILEFTEGYPYYLQEYGRYVWNIATGDTIRVSDVERARPLVQAQLDDNFFQVRIGRTTKAERRYMSAMAQLGGGPYRSGDIATELGRPQTSVALVRGRLISKGLIYSPAYGLSDFTVPHFDGFMRRTYPLRRESTRGRRKLKP